MTPDITLKCPHCKHVFDYEVTCDDQQEVGDIEGDFEVCCPECDGDITVTQGTIYVYSSEHEYDPFED